jgi:lipoate-protein ligase A
MQYLPLTLSDAARNLALDEALLEEAESSATPVETLRVWESPEPFVVLGRSSRVAAEVREDVCRQLGVPILRRISGGATVLAGPGCLMYALVLSYERRPALRMLSEAHRTVMETMVAALSPLISSPLMPSAPSSLASSRLASSTKQTVQYRGTCDLTIGGARGNGETVGDLKFSGNSVRCRRTHLLYHGTLLYDFSLDLVERCLTMPPRTPDYREGRSHERFIANLPARADAICTALRTGWKAETLRNDWPRERMEQLVLQKYAYREWNA